MRLHGGARKKQLPEGKYSSPVAWWGKVNAKDVGRTVSWPTPLAIVLRRLRGGKRRRPASFPPGAKCEPRSDCAQQREAGRFGDHRRIDRRDNQVKGARAGCIDECEQISSIRLAVAKPWRPIT